MTPEVQLPELETALADADPAVAVTEASGMAPPSFVLDCVR